MHWEKAKGIQNEALPQIVWANGTPWREANLWAHTQHSKGKNSKTVASAMGHIYAYAKWLESEGIDWWHFPARESERCLVRFRGFLIDERDQAKLAPSTAKQRMATVVRLYRWLTAANLISPEWPMWQDKTFGVQLVDTFGFQRTMRVSSTDLAIPNRKIPGFTLEDGLLPVAASAVGEILTFADEHASQELAIMLRIGFGTGMRIGSICDLQWQTLERAVPDPCFPGFYFIAIGPGAHPPVKTKFGVTGQTWICTADLDLLKTYMFSTRRLRRQLLAAKEDKNHIFLTRYGKRYEAKGNSSVRAVTVEMARLREVARSKQVAALQDFKFHQSRCTFATELAKAALRHGNPSFAIQLVKRALLHRHEATTLKYIKFIEQTQAMATAADEFTKAFLGLASIEAGANV